MDRIMPWPDLLAVVEPFYPKVSEAGGRTPIALERMLRIYFLQLWFNFPDPAVEEALYDSAAMRSFAGIDLGQEAAPDETTVCKFRHLLERHKLGKQLLKAVNEYLARNGIKISNGTIVDATIISVPEIDQEQEPLCWPLWRYWTPDTQTSGSGAVISSHFRVTIYANQNLLDGFTDTSLKWGQNGLSHQGVNVGYIATASWNPRSVVLPYYPPCSFLFNGSSAPCDQTTRYKPVHVPDGTYEDEVHIPNPQCTVSSRTGTPDDRPYGCYVASGYETNFPRPYLDTNIFDGPAYYIATMGSAEGQSLNATSTYRNKIYFWAYGNTGAVGYIFHHKGQIGTRIPSICYSEFCVFSTNTATYRSAPVISTGTP